MAFRVALAALLLPAGCISHRSERLEDVALPNNAIPLSEMMRGLAATPGAPQQILDKLESGPKSGFPVSPPLLRLLREIVLGRQWERLDSFPGISAHDLALTANEADRYSAKHFPDKRTSLAQFLDVGSYALDADGTVDLDAPAPAQQDGITGTAPVDFGDGIKAGDGNDPKLYPMHARSLQLAFVLNRLAVNPQSGLSDKTLSASAGGTAQTRPEEVVRELESSGHTVTIRDRRYFANFGHLHYNGRDVVMPFWVNAQVWVPGTFRRLLVPVSHTELEMTVTGSRVNAVVAFYFGVEGKAEFRTTDTLNQAWVMGATKHAWSGADAVEITRLLGEEIAAYERAHLANPQLPAGGYYRLGVCQDSIATVEEKMTGTVTMFPLTVDPSYFSDPRSSEVAALMRGLPSDRRGLPSIERVLDTLPVDSATQVPFPQLRSDIERVQQVRSKGGRLRRRSPWALAAIVALLVGVVSVWRRSRRRQTA